jgi:hypothetical protein
MARYLKSREGRALLGLGVGVLAIVGAFMIQRAALASVYSSPFWTNSSASVESAVPSVAELAMVTESSRCRSDSCGDIRVDARTGELFWDFTLFTTPGLLGDNAYAIRWRSMISGASQLGRQILPNWETTANYVIVNVGDPSAANGHYVEIRRGSGRVDVYWWNGSSYTKPTNVYDALTIHGGTGNYLLTDKFGGSLLFDANGMPSQVQDTNGNITYFTVQRLLPDHGPYR